MRSKSTLLLIAIGCLGWYAVNKEAIEASSRGEAATYDLWFPFLTFFGLAALVRAIYRNVSRKTKSNPKPKSSEKEIRADSAVASTLVEKSEPNSDNERIVLDADHETEAPASPQGVAPRRPDSDEIQTLRREIAEAEEEHKAHVELERLKGKVTQAQEALEGIRFLLGAAESELRGIRLGGGDELKGEERISFLKKQLASAEAVEGFKAELKVAETNLETAELELRASSANKATSESDDLSDLQKDRERRYRQSRQQGPKIKKVAIPESKTDEATTTKRAGASAFWKNRVKKTGGSPSEQRDVPAKYRSDWREVELAQRMEAIPNRRESENQSVDEEPSTPAEFDYSFLKYRRTE